MAIEIKQNVPVQNLIQYNALSRSSGEISRAFVMTEIDLKGIKTFSLNSYFFDYSRRQSERPSKER